MKIRILLEGKEPGGFQEAETWRRAWELSFGKALGECSTEKALLAGWMHLFLWAMNDSDRALILGIVLGKPVEVEEIATLPKEVGLKRWEDFPDAYQKAPVRLDIA